MRFEGIYTPVITPFRSDLSIWIDLSDAAPAEEVA